MHMKDDWPVNGIQNNFSEHIWDWSLIEFPVNTLFPPSLPAHFIFALAFFSPLMRLATANSNSQLHNPQNTRSRFKLVKLVKKNQYFYLFSFVINCRRQLIKQSSGCNQRFPFPLKTGVILRYSSVLYGCIRKTYLGQSLGKHISCDIRAGMMKKRAWWSQ